MPTQRFQPIPQPDRWSYLWFAAAAALSLFVTGRWTVAAAVWLAPVFAIRFMRTQKAWKGFLLLALASSVTAVISWRGLMPLPFPEDVITLIMIGIVSSLILLADRLLVARWQRRGRNPFVTTLIYPSLVTAFEFLTVQGNPMGSFGASAYTQFGNLPLLQLVSVTGLWGVTFVISWLAPVVNWAWEHGFAWPQIRRGTAVYAGVMALIFIFGVARLAASPNDVPTVPVAGVTAVPLDFAHLNSLSWQGLRRQAAINHDQYFTASERLAQAGAQLLLWPEGAAVVAEEDEVGLMARAQAFAQQHNVYLALPLVILHPQADHYENELRVIAPDGGTALTHRKYGGYQFEVGSVPGDGVLHTAVTPLGTLAGVICWDTDFPATVAQAGRKDVDILLSPSKDDVLLPMADLHAEMAAFRAIENGVTVIRQSDAATSMVIDPYGRVLAQTPFNANGETVLTAQVPAKGVTTLYSRVGDVFGWLTAVASVVWVSGAIVAGRRTKVDPAPEPDGLASTHS